MTVKLFKNTGFDAVNIPESPSMVETLFTPVKTYNNINLIQSNYLANIIVDDIESDDAKGIDYVIVENSDEKSCYTVEQYEFLGNNTCRFYLLIDPYNTIGGFVSGSGNEVLSASANRMSVDEDEDDAFFFTLDEPFQPSEKLLYGRNDLKYSPSIEENARFIETITMPPKIEEADLVKDDGELPVTHEYVPKVDSGTLANGVRIACASEATRNKGTKNEDEDKVNISSFIPSSNREMKETKLLLIKFTGIETPEYVEIGLGTRWWENDNEVTTKWAGSHINGSLIEDFRKIGRDNDVINYWEVPRVYLLEGSEVESNNYNGMASDANVGGVDKIGNSLKGGYIHINFTDVDIQNKKAGYSQSISILAYSPCSGEQIEKRVHEIINTGDTTPDVEYYLNWLITADIRPSGYPIFIWRYTHGINQDYRFIEAIKGGKWRSIELGTSGARGIELDKMMLNAQTGIEQKEKVGQGVLGALGVVGGGLMMATGVGGAMGGAMVSAGVGNIVGAISGYVASSRKQKEQEQLLNIQGLGASARLNIGNTEFARDIGLNWFFCIVSRYSERDMTSYDNFLEKFGYNVGNKTVELYDFNSRPEFNYLRLNDITIKSKKGNISLINEVREQLKAGVRIWHEKPNEDAMIAGGNKFSNGKKKRSEWQEKRRAERIAKIKEIKLREVKENEREKEARK